MATWTDIPNGDVDPGSPLSTALMTALRDNGVVVYSGEGQTWQDVTASRAHSTSYQNTTGRTIFVMMGNGVARDVQVSTDNTTWVKIAAFQDNTSRTTTISFPVFDLLYYRINGSVTNLYWAELR